jgi:hypothetical protein
MCLDERVGAAFVPTHQARVANHIYRDNSGKSALFVGHQRIPPKPITIILSVLKQGNRTRPESSKERMAPECASVRSGSKDDIPEAPQDLRFPLKSGQLRIYAYTP